MHIFVYFCYYSKKKKKPKKNVCLRNTPVKLLLLIFSLDYEKLWDKINVQNLLCSMVKI